MSYVRRLLDLSETLKSRSVLLLGPRQTGKSSLLRNQLPKQPDFNFNFLYQKLFLELNTDPTLMRQRILASGIQAPLVVIG